MREIRVLSIWFEGHLILATKTSPTKLYRFATLDGPGTHWPAYVGDLKGEPRISMLRAYGRVTFRGDNVEAGDFFPLESCDVIMLAESRHVYRVLAR